MTHPCKKLLVIITALLACLAFTSSCSKQPDAQTARKGGNAPAPGKPAKATKAVKATFIPAGKSSLNAVRNGQSVTLNWKADLSGVTIRKIDITRSSTGKITNRDAVATLESGATSFKDSVPNENAWWYWVRFVTTDDKFQDIGPVRVNGDRAGSANYTKLADIYKISITRTDDFATIKWDFPEAEYSSIRVVRSFRPLPGPFKAAAKTAPVVESVERQSQYTDALNDPNTDHWYWFRITLKSGAIIERGPIKAEYSASGGK